MLPFLFLGAVRPPNESLFKSRFVPRRSLGVSHAFSGLCCVDTQARGMLMNMHQCNGKKVCAWRTNEGEVAREGNGHAGVYSTAGPKLALRMHDSFLKGHEVAEQAGQAACDVKGPSILLRLSILAFPCGFVVVYKRAVCSGFAGLRQLCGSEKSKHFLSLSGEMNKIDCRLQFFQLLWKMLRLLRALHLQKY